ncbi:hypothetical protein FQA47_021240 [Oryzias melastigma]|uniref:Uncharacterized protein n=1 Tax=Oryzias melastigma TaxID=30732 RepID=A0A834F1C1_ORYME|nr:hypothetical protein FQA47_021240 [Oryzias melastigma]
MNICVTWTMQQSSTVLLSHLAQKGKLLGLGQAVRPPLTNELMNAPTVQKLLGEKVLLLDMSSILLRFTLTTVCLELASLWSCGRGLSGARAPLLSSRPARGLHVCQSCPDRLKVEDADTDATVALSPSRTLLHEAPFSATRPPCC